MYKQLKRIFSICLSVLLVFSMFNINTVKADTEEKSADDLISELIAYYRDYQSNAKTDIMRTLDELKNVDATKAEEWQQIMDYWEYTNTDMDKNLDGEIEGLPNDNSLCIVVLGFALNPDGTMKDELVDRLEIGKKVADQYPNSYIAVTGGGTAANNPNVTEGQLMGEWLRDNGIAEDRLIIEDKAPNTVGNAENVYKILSEQYKQVKNLVIVTSDYHLPRGTILFYSKCLLSAYEAGNTPLNVLASAGCYTGSNGYESYALQASGVASVAGVNLPSNKLDLSMLNGLTISQDKMINAGEKLNLKVTAHYNTDYSRDVSNLIEVTGFDENLGSEQTIGISYSENGVEISTNFDLSTLEKNVWDNGYLKQILEKAKTINLDIYTHESALRLQNAIINAQNIINKGYDATKEELENSYLELNEAMSGLVKLPNVVKNLNVEANCNQSDAYKVNDGVVDTSNYWASVEDGKNVPSNEAEIVLDLDGLYDVQTVVVYPYWNGQRIYKYALYGSTDKKNWTKIGENVSDEYVTDKGISHEINSEISYLKLVGIETKVEGRPDINNIHLVEIEVYGQEKNNVAFNKPVKSSGTDNSAGSSANSKDSLIVDGNRETYWDGGAYTDAPWIEVDLQDVYKLDSLNVITYWNRNDRYYYYDVYTSLDGINYDLLYSKNKGTDLSTIYGENIQVKEKDVLARYVKVVGTYNSANASFHLNELRVYGEQMDYGLIQAREQLQKLVDEAEQLDLTNRSENSVKNLMENIKIANDLLDTDTSSKEDIVKTIANLQKAIDDLEYVSADYSKVDEAIQRANTLNPEDYKDFSKVDEAINAVMRGLDITHQKEVDAMAEAIIDAIDSLEKKSEEPNVSKDTLKELIDKLSSLDGTLFTKESWDIFQSALNDAEEVYAKENVTQEEIDTAFKNLNQAYKGLVKADTGNGKDEDTDQPVKPVAPTVPDDSKDTDTEVKDDVGTGAENNSYALGILFFGAAAGAVMLLRKRKLENK